jgi:hypothetical protein
MSYDSRVYDLAELFLSDETAKINTEDNRKALAQHIQDELEMFIAYLRPEPEQQLKGHGH